MTRPSPLHTSGCGRGFGSGRRCGARDRSRIRRRGRRGRWGRSSSWLGRRRSGRCRSRSRSRCRSRSRGRGRSRDRSGSGSGRGSGSGSGSGCRGRGRSRSRSRSGCRSRGRGRSRGWSRLGGRGSSRRQESKRIEVALVVGGEPNAEVYVRFRNLGVARGSDSPDDLPVGDRGAPGDSRCAEMRERDRVAVSGCHCDDEPATRHRPDVGHDSACCGVHLLAGSCADVDSPMLTARVRIGAEAEGSEHSSTRRPRPRMCTRRQQEQAERHRGDENDNPTHSGHWSRSSLQSPSGPSVSIPTRSGNMRVLQVSSILTTTGPRIAKSPPVVKSAYRAAR